MIKVIVIEDEDRALEEIVRELARFEDIDVVGQCGDLFEAMKQIRDHQPDVIFLDVHLPGHAYDVPRSHEEWPAHGFTLLDYMESDEHRPHVVIVSNHTQHALRAIQAHVLDFLPKNEFGERLDQTIEDIRHKIANDSDVKPYPDELLDHIICRFMDGFKRVPIEEVEYVHSSSEAGVYVYCADGHSYFTEMILTRMVEKTRLIKCHGSWLVNIEAVDTYKPTENGRAEISTRSNENSTIIPISRNYKKPVEIALGIKNDNEQNKDESIS